MEILNEALKINIDICFTAHEYDLPNVAPVSSLTKPPGQLANSCFLHPTNKQKVNTNTTQNNITFERKGYLSRCFREGHILTKTIIVKITAKTVDLLIFSKGTLS